MFTALHRDDFVFSADTLDAALAFVAEIYEPAFNEDVTVWQGHRVAAVCLSDGRVLRLDGAPPAVGAEPPSALADAAPEMVRTMREALDAIRSPRRRAFDTVAVAEDLLATCLAEIDGGAP